jgi:hypothetical protein
LEAETIAQKEQLKLYEADLKEKEQQYQFIISEYQMLSESINKEPQVRFPGES